MRQTDISLTAFFPVQPEFASTRKLKPIWILMKQEMMGWQRHQLNHMQVICISLQTNNHASISSLILYRPDAIPDTQPTVLKYKCQRHTTD